MNEEKDQKKFNWWIVTTIISSLAFVVIALSGVVYSGDQEKIKGCQSTANQALTKANDNCREIEVAKMGIKVEMAEVKRRLDKLESLQHEILREIRNVRSSR